MERIRKNVNDIGISAYLMLHGFRVVQRKNKTVIFEIEEKDSEEFDRLFYEYINTHYKSYDVALMSLKKTSEIEPKNKLECRTIQDLGQAAYLCMHKFKCVGRKSRHVYFSVSPEEQEDFDKIAFQFLTSLFHEFDANIMLLKRI